MGTTGLIGKILLSELDLWEGFCTNYEIQKLKKDLEEAKKKLINAQGELEDKELALQTLEQKLKNSPSNELQEKVNDYKIRIKKLKKKPEQKSADFISKTGRFL